MGKRGPKPKSSTLKILDGSGKGRLPAPNPEVIPGKLECPDHLSPVARAEFARMVVLLDASGVLSKADAGALSLYCETYAEWLEAKASIKANGLLIESADGAKKANPMIAVASQCKLLCVRLLKEFGFTPSSRSRVTRVSAEVPQDDLEEFLKRG